MTGVVSFVGAGTINATPNTGQLTIALKPIGQRERRGGGDRAAGAADRRHPRADRVVQAGAGYQDRRAGQPHRLSIHAAGHGCGRAGGMGAEAACAAGGAAATARTSPPTSRMRGSAPAGHRRSPGGDAAGRDHAGDRGHAVRRVRAAAGLHDFRQANQYRVVLEADQNWQGDPTRCGCCGCREPTTRRCRCRRVATITANVAPLVVTHQQQFPSATISFDLAPGVFAGRRGAGGAAGGAGYRHAGHHHRQLFRRCGGVPALAGREPWLILASVVVIYIVLGVLYESWIHPVTILSTLPSAGIGALLALMVCGATCRWWRWSGSCC